VSAAGNAATNKDFVKGIYKAFARGDAAGVMASLDSDILWAYPDGLSFTEGSPFRGPSEVFNKVFVRLATEWENFKVEPVEYIAEGDRVVVLVHETGSYRETGATVEVDSAHVWTIRDGRVVEFYAYADTLAFARAAGLA
jgi:ketosteroid isomerase-like protein